MVWRSLLIGVVVTAAILAGFRFYGVRFFIDGRSPFQINFAAAAAVGLVLGLVGPWLAGARGDERLRSAVWIALPALLVLAAVTSHFGIVFKPLNPVMDKVFGALMLWGAGFLLAGGLVRWRR